MKTLCKKVLATASTTLIATISLNTFAIEPGINIAAIKEQQQNIAYIEGDKLSNNSDIVTVIEPKQNQQVSNQSAKARENLGGGFPW